MIEEGVSHHSHPIKWKASVLPKKVLNRKEAKKELKTQKEKKTIKEYVKEGKLPIFFPFGLFLSFWNAFLFILLIYSVIETPFIRISICLDCFIKPGKGWFYKPWFFFCFITSSTTFDKSAFIKGELNEYVKSLIE